MSTPENQTPQDQPVHVVSLRVEKYKRIKVAVVVPNPEDRLVVVGGRNDQGKTSLLDSIVDAMRGRDASPVVPVQKGHKKARIVLDLGDIVVKVRFTSAGGREVVVENADGTKFASPQAVMDKLTAKVSFDAEDFIRKSAPDQRAILQRIVGLDFAPIEAKKNAAFQQRALVNAEVKRLEAVVASSPKHEGVPETETSSTEIVAEIEKVNAHNSGIRDALRKLEDVDADVGTGEATLYEISTRIEQIGHEIAAAEHELKLQTAKRADATAEFEAIKTRARTYRAEVEAMKEIDPAPYRVKLAGAEDSNRKVRANRSRAESVISLKGAKERWEGLNSKVEGCDAEKQTMLETAKFPVKGLSFSETGVLYDGLPFEQASSSVRRKVSVAIGAALNPKFRVMIVRDGSLLDAAATEELRLLAHEHNLQVWVELVTESPLGDKGPDPRCTVILEEGEVFGAPVEPEAPPEEAASSPAHDANKAAGQEDLGFGG